MSRLHRPFLVALLVAVAPAGCESREKKLERLTLERARTSASMLSWRNPLVPGASDSLRAYELRLSDIQAEIDEILRQR